MEVIALIVSGLALLAAGVCLYLLKQEKKRSQERNAALLQYIDTQCKAASAAAPEAIREAAEAIVAQAVNDVCEKIAEPYTNNDFGLGIHNIMNFDPRDSIIRQREKERAGE